MKLGSLFTGIGGIDLAFQRAGFEIGFQVEIDDYCNKVLARHWPTVPRFGDIRAVKGADLPAIDVLAGGFPCQDISAAGKGAGIKEGTRSGLWFEFARLIGEIRPRVVLLENVAAILSRDGVRVIADLAALGYGAEWGIISAADAGAPHRRERWFCVAYPKSYQSSSAIWTGGDNRQSAGASEWTGLQHRFSQHGNAPMGHAADEGLPQPGQSSVTTLEAQDGAGLVIQPERSGVGLADAESQRMEGCRTDGQRVTGIYAEQGLSERNSSGSRAGDGAIESLLGRAVDGLSRQLDGTRWPVGPGQQQHDWEAPRTVAKGQVANRAARLKALGNAVMPQVIYPIAVAIREHLETDQ